MIGNALVINYSDAKKELEGYQYTLYLPLKL